MRWPWGTPSETNEHLKIESRESRAELIAVVRELDSYRARLRRVMSELQAATRQSSGKAGDSAYGS